MIEISNLYEFGASQRGNSVDNYDAIIAMSSDLKHLIQSLKATGATYKIDRNGDYIFTKTKNKLRVSPYTYAQTKDLSAAVTKEEDGKFTKFINRNAGSIKTAAVAVAFLAGFATKAFM